MNEKLHSAVGAAVHGALSKCDVMNYLNMPDDTAEKVAQAAIATMFERLRTPSEGMVETGEYAWMNRDLSDPDSHPIRDCFRAMLTAFQQENSDV